MSSVSDPSPEDNYIPESPLVLLLDGHRENFPADRLDEEQRQQIAQACAAATSPPVFVIANLVDWNDEDRFVILRLIASVPNARVRVAEHGNDSSDLFQAVLSMMVDHVQIDRCGRGRRAAIEAAALVYPENGQIAANRISQRLHSLGVRGHDADVRTIGNENPASLAALRRITNPDQGLSLRVGDILADAPGPEAAVVPAGWTFNASGISRRDNIDPMKMVPSPVFIVRRLANIDNNSECVELCFIRDAHYKTKIINRAAIASARSIVDLADIGLPVTSNNAAVLVQFLSDFESQNIEFLPVARVTGRLGWVGENGRDGFLCGNTLITGNNNPVDEVGTIRFAGADDGEEQIAAGFHAAGTNEGWRHAVMPLAAFPRVKFGLYAALSTPLLEILGAENSVDSYAGATSQGKTTALRASASLWGCPDERNPASVLHTWDSTRFFIESIAALQNGLPLLVDDTKRARFKDDVSRVIYDVASGHGRGRGSTTGVRRTTTYATVMITTGEEPITSFSEDGGTRARAPELSGSPFGQADADTGRIVNTVNAGILENFGHAGPRFVRFLIQHRDRWPAWKTHYRRLCERLQRRAGDDPVAGRIAKHLALIQMTTILAGAANIFPWRSHNVVRELWPELMAEAPEADRAAASLRYVWNWACSHPAEFFNQFRLVLNPPLHGWAGRWDAGLTARERWTWLGFLPYRLDEILLAGGFSPKAILRIWHDRGWLRVSGGRLQFRARLDGNNVWLVAIERNAIEEVDGALGDTAVPMAPPPARGSAPPTLPFNGSGTSTSPNGSPPPSVRPAPGAEPGSVA